MDIKKYFRSCLGLLLLFLVITSTRTSAATYFYTATDCHLELKDMDIVKKMNKYYIQKCNEGAIYNAKTAGNTVYFYGRFDRYTKVNWKNTAHWLTENKKHHFKLNSKTKYYKVRDDDEHKPQRISKEKMFWEIRQEFGEDCLGSCRINIITKNGYVSALYYIDIET